MRILVVTSEYPPYVWGGLGRYSSEVVAELRHRAVVDVLCVPSYPMPLHPGSAEMETGRGRTFYGRPAYLAPGNGGTRELAISPPAREQPVDADLREWLDPPYDALFVQDFFQAQLAAELLHDRIGRKIIAFSHLPLYSGFSYFDRPFEADFQHALEAWLFRLAARVIVPSRFARQVVVQSYGLNDDRITVLPEGVGVPRETGPRKRVPANAPLRLLTVARLTEQKGVPYMIDLADALEARDLDFVYTIVGSGRLEPYLRERVQRSGARDRITHIDTIGPTRAMFDLYRSSDILVVTTLFETFGLVLLEAMACGCVPVAFSVGSNEEVLGPDSGRLVPIGDVGAMADEIVRLDQDPSLREGIAAHGRKAAQTATWSRHVDGVIELLRGDDG